MTESVSQMSNVGNEETLPPINVSVSKKRRNLPGRPDPDAEVIALSPRSLLTTNRFVCEICSKGFQRDQNLQLHRRGHNLPWRLKQKESHEYRKKVYICPELNCVHHDPARALGDLTGIKKHFSRKHGEKKWKCDKCSKRYAVQSDWKAHQKTCGTKEYRCDCGYLFSRKDSFITHRAFCDVLENNKDLPCNDEQEQKPAASADENANKITIEMDMPTPMDASASPVSPVTCDEGPCMKPPKPNLTERGSDTAISESGVVALSSKWPQGGISANNCGSHQGSELSLRLGTDLGPGPPNDAQVAVTQKSPVPIFGYPSPRGSNKLGFSQLASAESQISSKHIPSVGAMGMLASLFSSSAHRQSGVDGIDSVAHSFSISDHDHCSISAGLSSSAYDLKSAYGPSRTYLPTSSAATSATALLQKAAELGAKASNPSMLQWYGKGDRDSKMSTNMQETARGSPWSGFSASHAATVQVKARQSEDHVKSAEFWGSTSSSLSQKSDNIHVTGLSDNVCLPASALLNVPFQAKVHGNSSLALKHGHLKEKENSSTTQSDSGFEMGCIQHEGGRSQTGDVENRMVDFLGVNASRAVISGSSAGMGQILSQRDVASVPSLMPGIRVSKRFQYPNSSVGQ